MNAWRVPYEAHMRVVAYASEGSALQSMWRSLGLQPVGAPHLMRWGGVTLLISVLSSVLHPGFLAEEAFPLSI